MNHIVFGSEKKQAEMLDQILAIGQAVQGYIAENPRQVYQLMVEVICKMTGADCAVIYPYHPAFGEFYDVDNVAAHGLRHKLRVERKANKRKGLAARVHREDEVIREDIEREEPQLPDESPFIAKEEIKAFMGLSLKLGGNTLGILYVDYREPHHFSQEERQIIRLFDQQAAMAISNAWNFRLAGMRAETVARLKMVGQTLIAIEDPSKTLDSMLDGIARSAQEVLDADIVDLYQYIQARNEFVLPPTLVGERLHPRLVPTRIYDDDVVVAAVKMGEPRYFYDARAASLLTRDFEIPHDDAPDERFVVREKVASSAIIPLVVAAETVGVMFVNYRTPQFFGPGQKDVIESFAAQAASAIHNARLFQQVSSQAQALAELNELAPQLVSIEESPQGTRKFLEQVASSAQEVLKADLIELYEYLQGQDEYRLPQISIGEIRRPLTPKDKVYADDAVFQLIHREEPLYVERVQDSRTLSGPYTVERKGQPTERFVVREGIQSTATIPLRTGSETVGLMFASYRTPQSFTAEQRQIIELFANQAAIAIHNSRLFSVLDRRVNALSALNEVGQTLTSGLRLQEDEILELVYEQARKLTGTQDMYIALYDDATGMVRFGIAMEGGQRVEIAEPRKADMERRGKTEEVIFIREPLLHRTKQEAEDWYQLPGHTEFIGRVAPSWMGVPMMVGEKVLGMIAVYDWEREYAYDELDLQVLSSMASQVAIALDNASLYYEVNQALKRRVQALSVLNEVGQTLTSGLRLQEDEILELIYEQARKLTGTQDMYIALHDDATGMIRFGIAMEGGQRVEIAEPRQADMQRRGKTEEVIFTRESLLHRTKQEAEDWYQLPGHTEFIGRVQTSYLGVPMMVGEKVLGVIAVYDWEREHVYDKQDLQVLASMASQAAIALDNAALLNGYKAAREELIAARQLAALGTVTAAIQHRINNTLNIIGPNTTRLRRRVDTSDETIREILDIIERNTKYTSDYIARIQEPLKETEIQAVDINASLREAQAQVWGEYRDRPGLGTVEVIYNLDDVLPLIEASLGQITEIFRNLIENGYKAMSPDGGTLTIASRRIDDRLEVEIQDTGSGIPSNIVDKLFIKPGPSRKPGEGSGLGLWLTNLLLQKYAGEISIEKTGVGGTTMLVRLPVSRS
jgi:GAF domain-containing protein/anti-sigma regulatory factor (Ser/Thr protein kinase)